MRQYITLFLFILGTISLSNNNQLLAQNQADQQFDNFVDFFLGNYWTLNPVSASYNGLSEFDKELPIPSAAEYQKQVRRYGQFLTLLKKNDYEALSIDKKTDYQMIEDLINRKIWYLTELKAYEWNPTVHNVGGQFDKILKGGQTNEHKLAAIYEKLKKLPTYFKAVQQLINNPTLEHTQLAISQNKGSLSIFKEDIPAFIKKQENKKGLAADYKEVLSSANATFEEYIAYLENEAVRIENAPSKRSFRLENAVYAQKFKHDMASEYSADEIFQIALKEKKEIHEKMKALVIKLAPKYLNKKIANPNLKQIRMVIDKIAENHVKKEEFVDAIKKQIPDLEAFVSKKNLIDLDPSKPLEVRETPKYMRGVAGASITAPGPYEKERPTYYNVTPLDNYSKEEAESYLREYNFYILQILNIHEAVPGHYTQLLYANQSPSLIKSLFGNGMMIEGWACYVERMMLEEGYGEDSPEMWLMYYKWNLRELCNALIDIGIHTKDWTKEEVMNILINEAFQEQTEADGKWKRATLSQVQLCSYYTGLTEIYHFREEQKKQLKNNFNLKEFHNQFLSYGSIPIKAIKALMTQ